MNPPKHEPNWTDLAYSVRAYAQQNAQMASLLSIAVIVPTYRRPGDLLRCLQALRSQTRPAEQLILVVRDTDEVTRAALRRVDPTDLTLVTVATGGVVAALNAGMQAARADLIAFTDDDAAPRPDWLQRIAAHFLHSAQLGGVGGRDWVHQHGRLEAGAARTVGRITWFGRCIGNHHLGVGPPREVDALKGVNMSFRARALEGVRFDERLRGAGAQVCNELGVSLAVKRGGWKLRYDPQIEVDHYPARRHDVDQRNVFSEEALYNATFNETLLLCEHFRTWRRAIYLSWGLAIGHRASPGLLQWLRLLVIERRTATARLRVTRRARLAGWRASR